MGHHRPTLPISRELAAELAPRILRRIERTTDGCWIRTTAVNPKTGYSQISKSVASKVTNYYAHRVMYVHAKGPIPEGLTIDHLCEQRACCNPEHLRAVTPRANVLRSKTAPPAICARRSLCPRGHKYSPSGHAGRDRLCPDCRLANARARRARMRAEGMQPGEAHGTRQAHRLRGCRCAACVAWQADDWAKRKAAAARRRGEA